MKPLAESIFWTQLHQIRLAAANGELLKYAKDVAANAAHPISRFVNQYPELPFEVDQGDLQIIRARLNFPNAVPEHHEWTALEKILYSQLWKDGKLKSIHRIIDGVASGLAQTDAQPPPNAVVYHQFGKHLTARLSQPIIDQHSIRAYKLIRTGEDNKEIIDQIRRHDKTTVEDAEAYCDWFRKRCPIEAIDDYSTSRTLDAFLFGFGKAAKLSKKKKGRDK